MRPSGGIQKLVESGLCFLVATPCLIGVLFYCYALVFWLVGRIDGRHLTAYFSAVVMVGLLGGLCGYLGVRRLLEAGMYPREDE